MYFSFKILRYFVKMYYYLPYTISLFLIMLLYCVEVGYWYSSIEYKYLLLSSTSKSVVISDDALYLMSL